VSSMWCFQCGAEYEVGVAACLECGVGLVAERPIPPEEVGEESDEQLAYELHDWAYESRRMLDQLLTANGIAHAWQGATMIVRADDEDPVDALVEEVEHATLPTLDPEREHTVYEMAGWTAEQQTLLSTRLGLEGIPHEFDVNGDLVVHAEDEDTVDELLDGLERDLAAGDDAGGTLQLDDLAVNDLLSKAFGAADTLRNDTHDHQAVLSFIDAAGTIEQLAMPYGFEREQWQAVCREVLELRDGLEADDADDDELESLAGRVRETLVRLI
jgi:hypothetical protein